MEYFIGAVIFVILFGIHLGIKTYKYKPLNSNFVDFVYEIDFDIEKVKAVISKFVQCKSFSGCNTYIDNVESVKLLDTIREHYKLIDMYCEKIRLDNMSYCFVWKGKCSSNPSILCFHYDITKCVEFVNLEFNGQITENYVKGIGTRGCKSSLASVLYALNEMLFYRHVPNKDVYILFSADRHFTNASVNCLIEYLKKNDLKPRIVLDEHSGICEHKVFALNRNSVFLGVSNKGELNIDIYANDESSLKLIKEKILNIKFKSEMSYLSRENIDTIGRYTKMPYKILYANFDLFKWAIKYRFLSKKSLKYMVLDTVMVKDINVNQISIKYNFINEKNVAKFKEKISFICKKYNASVVYKNFIKASEASSLNGKEFDLLNKVISKTWNGFAMIPILIEQPTQASSFKEICNEVYSFSPLHYESLIEQKDRTKERIYSNEIERMCRFYFRLLNEL